MVDRIEAYEDGEQPTIFTSRNISSNEPIFDGHFPGLHLWPGVYTIEGLLQSSALLHIIWEARKQAPQPDDIFEVLKNLELGYRFHPGYQPALTERFATFLG